MNGITWVFNESILHFGFVPFIFIIISVIIMVLITIFFVYKELKGVEGK